MVGHTIHFLANQKRKNCSNGRVQKQYNNKVELEEKKGLSVASLPAPETRLEEEISELRNFVTVFKDGRENYETKMVTVR
jgi:hypothetical protein